MNTEAGTVAWSTLLTEAVGRLEVAGISTAAVDARRIVEEAAGVEPAEFHSVLDLAATGRGVARFDALLARREAGEPLQYVLGRWGFRYLDLMVDRRVLVPRPETEMVAGLVVSEVELRASLSLTKIRVADLGTGSGAIGLSVASECGQAQVFLTDISEEALQVAGANLAGIGRAATRVSIHAGSWFEALEIDLAGTLDVIVANPPYVADDEELPPVVELWEPRQALRSGPAGTEALTHVVENSRRWLRPDGVLILEMAPHQIGPITELCVAIGFTASVRQDLAGRDRAVVARLGA